MIHIRPAAGDADAWTALSEGRKDHQECAYYPQPHSPICGLCLVFLVALFGRRCRFGGGRL
jgi:hypothetical protein